MTDATDPFIEAVRALNDRTAERSIKWTKADSESTFLYTASRSSVIVDQWHDAEGDKVVKVAFLNHRGEEVGVVRSRWQENPWGPGVAPSPMNAELEQLWEGARRAALNVDEVLDSLMADLKAAERN